MNNQCEKNPMNEKYPARQTETGQCVLSPDEPKEMSTSFKVLNQIRHVEERLNSLADDYHKKLAPIAYQADPYGENQKDVEEYPEYFEQLRASIASMDRTIDGLFNLLDRTAL